MRKYILFAFLALATAGCDLSDTDEGDTYLPPTNLDPFVILDTDLVREQSTCEPERYWYRVRASVIGLADDERVVQITIASSCGAGASILGQSGDTDLILTSCGPCSITAEAVMTKGTAIPAEQSVSPCEELDCEEE